MPFRTSPCTVTPAFYIKVRLASSSSCPFSAHSFLVFIVGEPSHLVLVHFSFWYLLLPGRESFLTRCQPVPMWSFFIVILLFIYLYEVLFFFRISFYVLSLLFCCLFVCRKLCSFSKLHCVFCHCHLVAYLPARSFIFFLHEAFSHFFCFAFVYRVLWFSIVPYNIEFFFFFLVEVSLFWYRWMHTMV